MSSILDKLTCQTDSPLKNCVFTFTKSANIIRQKENGSITHETMFYVILYTLLIYTYTYILIEPYFLHSITISEQWFLINLLHFLIYNSLCAFLILLHYQMFLPFFSSQMAYLVSFESQHKGHHSLLIYDAHQLRCYELLFFLL